MAQAPYTTTTNLKNYLKIATTDTSNDGFLSLLIPQAMSFIDGYTGRTFGWGDTGDTALTDYSNTGNLGITSATIVGQNCTFNFYAGTPFVVGATVIASGWTLSAINGTWVVTSISSDTTQVTVNIGTSPGNQTVSNASQTGILYSDVQNYQFVQQEAYDGLVGHTFYLMNMDIRSIDAMWIGSRNIYPPVLLNPQQYVWRNDGRIILGGAYFNTYNSADYTGEDETASFYGTIAAGFQTITVSYHHGYTGVPPEISLACEDIISAMYYLRLSQGVVMEQAGDYRIQYNPLLRQLMRESPDTLGILQRYRRVNI